MASCGGGRGDWRRGVALLLAASERLYGVLLALYPKAFRGRYAAEMRRDFRELSRQGLEEGRGTELARVWTAAFSDLARTALQERGDMLARNGYLPIAPNRAARWGAICAVAGGLLGASYSVAFTVAISSGTPDGAAWWGPRSYEVHFVATLLSVLGLFGLYSMLVARSGRPGRLALGGAAFGALSVASVLAQRAWHMALMLGWVRPGLGDFSWWTMQTGLILDMLGMGGCSVGLLLLGASAVKAHLLGRLSVLPFVAAALWPASIALLVVLNTHGIDRISWLSGALPFLGAALSGWVLLRTRLDTPPAASSGVAEVGSQTAWRAAVRRSVGQGRTGRRRSLTTEGAKEKELLKALGRRGALTVAGAALETSLTVEEADRMLSALAAKGHLEVRVEHGRLLYSLWEGDAPP